MGNDKRGRILVTMPPELFREVTRAENKLGLDSHAQAARVLIRYGLRAVKGFKRSAARTDCPPLERDQDRLSGCVDLTHPPVTDGEGDGSSPYSRRRNELERRTPENLSGVEDDHDVSVLGKRERNMQHRCNNDEDKSGGGAE